MKASFKLFALLLAVCCIVTLIPLISFADTDNLYARAGEVYKKSENSIKLETKLSNNSPSTVEPGENVYVIIREYEPQDYKHKVKSMKITAEDSDSRLILANQALYETIILKDNDGKRFECAVIPLKSINVSKFNKESTYTYFGSMDIKFKESKNSTVSVHDDIEDLPVTFTVGYDDPTSRPLQETLTKTAARYEFVKGDEYEFENTFDDTTLTLKFESTADYLAIMSCDNDPLDELEEVFGNYADFTYFNLHGTLSKVKNTKVTIDNVEEAGRYLYRYQNGTLYDLSNTYQGEEDDCFEVKVIGSSVELCTYVVSNYALDLTQSPILEGSQTVIAEEPTEPAVKEKPEVVIPNSIIPVIYGKIDDTQTTTRVTPAIPNTGAVC